MGGVVGGDGIHRSIGQALAHRISIIGRAQGRVDLEHRVVGGAGFVGEGEMVGSRLGGHLHPGLGGQPRTMAMEPRVDSVLEMDGSAGKAAEGDIPHDHELLGLGGHAGNAQPARPLPLVHVTTGGQGVHFAVLGQYHSQTSGVLHGPAHEPGFLNPVSVVGEQPHPQRSHLGHRRKLVPLAAHGDGPGGVHITWAPWPPGPALLARRRRSQWEGWCWA